jgi:hypothetical protein
MDLYTFSEPKRLTDRVFFDAQLNMKFGMDCFEREMPPEMRERIDAYTKKLAYRKFGMEDHFSCEFFNESMLLRRIAIPCFGYFGDFGIWDCHAELLDESPELLNEFVERGVATFSYNVFNVVDDLLANPINKLFGYWVRRAQDVIGPTQE